jgi:hypothetical protein
LPFCVGAQCWMLQFQFGCVLQERCHHISKVYSDDCYTNGMKWYLNLCKSCINKEVLKSKSLREEVLRLFKFWKMCFRRRMRTESPT